jgi:hypothetical protein
MSGVIKGVKFEPGEQYLVLQQVFAAAGVCYKEPLDTTEYKVGFRYILS